MLVKSLVAGTVLTLLAGGAVYYGTDAEGNISAQSGKEKLETVMSGKNAASTSSSHTSKMDHPHAGHKDGSEMGGAKESTPKNSAEIPSIKTRNGTLIDPKAESVEASVDNPQIELAEIDASTPADNSTLETDKSSETPTRKWIDQYLRPEPVDPQVDPKAETENIAEMEQMADAEAKEIAEMEAEIAEVLAQEQDIEEELSQMMAEMGETETLQPMDIESIEVDTSKNEMADDEKTKIELFTDEEILEAEAKGFEDRAKEIDNIWVSKDAPELSDADAKTLHDVLKDHKSVFMTDGADGDEKVDVKVLKDETGTTTTETETIDLGDGKVIKVVKIKRVEGGADDRTENKIHVKVLTDEGLTDVTESVLGHEVVETDTGKTIKIRKMKIPHAHKHHDKSCTDESHKDKSDKSESDKAVNGDVSETAKIIMAQAKKISMPELRDRAYLDLVSYALDNGDKDTANNAMSEIEQVELRDTARNRMAVSYAKAGNAEKAFAILEDLEVDALRDVMRLQVIEALIVPEAPTPSQNDNQ